MKKNNRIVFTVFIPQFVPDFNIFANTWNELIKKERFDGFYFIGDQINKKLKFSGYFDAFMHSQAILSNRNLWNKIVDRLVRHYYWTIFGPIKDDYSLMMKDICKKLSQKDNFIPTIFTGPDSTPRHPKKGVVPVGFDPASFKNNIKNIDSISTKEDLIFIKSWNEWEEGNTLEPDDFYGYQFLHILSWKFKK